LSGRKWPSPLPGQVLRVSKQCRGGWITAYFWPIGGGVHFVFQAVGDYSLQDASIEPLGEQWIAAILVTHMLGRGAEVALLPCSAGMREQLELWRTEVSHA
jgi:hypothetical protein